MPLEGVVPYPEKFQSRYRAAGYWEDRTMDEVFREAFACAERTAVTWADRTMNYAELQWSADRLAAHLWARGLRPLNRVIVHLPNCPEFLQLHFALQRLGVVPIMTLAAHRRHEIDHYVRLAEATAYCGADPALGREVQSENDCLRQIISLEELSDPGEDPAPPPFRADPRDPCVLLLSGGTTRIPKLIPRLHNDYLYNTRMAARAQEISDHTVQLCVLPLAHNMPLACPGAQGVFLAGGTLVLGASTRASDVLPAIERQAVPHVAAVPALYIRWLRRPSRRSHQPELGPAAAIRRPAAAAGGAPTDGPGLPERLCPRELRHERGHPVFHAAGRP